MQKKGVSELMGYVMLIAIAVGLSFLVYAYLKLYVPKDKIDCQEGIALALDSYTCHFESNPKITNLKLVNKGRFTVSAVDRKSTRLNSSH